MNDTDNWFRLAWCLNIWDLDVRAQYHGVVKIHRNKSQLLLIADPWSPFSFRPAHISPLVISEKIPTGSGRKKTGNSVK